MNTAFDRFASRISGKRILIIGDLIIDRYEWGKAERISPEAPVPVIDVQLQEDRLGGAGNVAMNILSMGATPVLCAVAGDDRDAFQLENLLNSLHLDPSLVIRETGRKTTVKTRVIAQQQQVLRIDKESRHPISQETRARLLSRVAEVLPGCDAVIFEDYDKGVLSDLLVAEIILLARKHHKLTVVDPKFRNFFAYLDVDVFKPNVKELNEALGIHLDRGDVGGITEAIGKLRLRMPHRNTMVTLSEHGVLVVDEDGMPHHIRAHVRKIADVAGAGDTVVSVLTGALACGLSLKEAAELANLAGGLVCEDVGVVPVDMERLSREATRHEA